MFLAPSEWLIRFKTAKTTENDIATWINKRSTSGECSVIKTKWQRLGVPSYVDADPQQQEQHTKSHEKRSHEGDQELFVDITSVFSGCYLVAED